MAIDNLPAEKEQQFKPNPLQPPPPPRKGRWALPADDMAQAMCVVKKRPVPLAPTIIPVPKKPRTQKRIAIDIPTRVLNQLNSYTGDREASLRLIQQVAQKNPDKSGQWCSEKALWDIQRDRL
jgi:hypothetical protein